MHKIKENLLNHTRPVQFDGPTIALVGFMGAGKSSVGKRLAYMLSRPFIDSDDEIEKSSGLTISDIFTIHGEAEFRRGEKCVIKRLVNGPAHIMATGGGAFMDPHTRRLLKEKTLTIWLKTDPKTLWKRVSRRQHRPLLQTENPGAEFDKLLKERIPVYAEADFTVDSTGQSIDAIITRIMDVLKIQA